MEYESPSGYGLPTLGDGFDAVLMLTWSHWQTEPRSNRYHYGSRFARLLPVLFLQPGLAAGVPITVEDSGVPGLQVVTLPETLTSEVLGELLQLLQRRGIRKPLLWIYSPIHYGLLLAALPSALRVYHATEDYLTPGSNWAAHTQLVAAVRSLLQDVDMIVGVSEKVNAAYVERGPFTGDVVLAPNGCDAGFFQALAQEHGPPPAANVCIFQGGINHRLDWDLLVSLADRMPDWSFWFCGSAVDDLPGWVALRERPNVVYLGSLAPESFGRKMCEATVGIIPFGQEDLIWNSLPLKAYEYVACGLPVVSVPIAALSGRPDLFAIERSAEGFAEAIRRVAPSRGDPGALALRTREAWANSYDGRFAHVVERIREHGPHRVRVGAAASAPRSGWGTVLSALRRLTSLAARRLRGASRAIRRG